MIINLHIERIVLDGIPGISGASAQVRTSVETELSSLLAEQGLGKPVSRAIPRANAADISFSEANGPAALGRQISRSVYAALRPTAEGGGGRAAGGSARSR